MALIRGKRLLPVLGALALLAAGCGHRDTESPAPRSAAMHSGTGSPDTGPAGAGHARKRRPSIARNDAGPADTVQPGTSAAGPGQGYRSPAEGSKRPELVGEGAGSQTGPAPAADRLADAGTAHEAPSEALPAQTSPTSPRRRAPDETGTGSPSPTPGTPRRERTAEPAIAPPPAVSAGRRAGPEEPPQPPPSDEHAPPSPSLRPVLPSTAPPPEAPPERRPRVHTRESGRRGRGTSASSSGRLAVIIDDIGMSTRQLTPFLDLDADLTYSIIPETRQARRCLALIESHGRVPLLHLPMEPLSRKDLLPADGITCDLGGDEIERRVSRDLDELAGVQGVNNHMGSRATQDERVMESVLDVVKRRGLFFIDSKTAEETVVAQVADRIGVPHAARSGQFLDDGGDTSRAYQILLDLGEEARRDGSAIAIGHPHPGTAQAIARALPELESMGVRIVPVSQLVH